MTNLTNGQTALDLSFRCLDSDIEVLCVVIKTQSKQKTPHQVQFELYLMWSLSIIEHWHSYIWVSAPQKNLCKMKIIRQIVHCAGPVGYIYIYDLVKWSKTVSVLC